MAISLCSALLLVTVSQAPPLPVAPTDSLTTLRGRAAQDSSDAQLWLLMGRAYLGLGVEAHGATHRSSEDSVWTRAVLDTAEEALGRAAALAGPLGSSAVGDSARVFRVGAWAARSWLGWEAGGVKAGVEAWGPLPMDLRVPPVLDELGENLLRACPAGGVLLTAGDADFYAAGSTGAPARGLALRCGAAGATHGGLEARASGGGRRCLARRAGAATSGVCEHGIRPATGDAAPHQGGNAAARVGGRTGREEPASPAA